MKRLGSRRGTHVYEYSDTFVVRMTNGPDFQKPTLHTHLLTFWSQYPLRNRHLTTLLREQHCFVSDTVLIGPSMAKQMSGRVVFPR